MRQRNKKLLIEFSLIISVSLILMIIIKSFIAFGVKHSNNAQTSKVNLIMQQKIDPQIIIFGSSVAEVGYNSNLISKLTNKTAYNSSIDGTRFEQYKYLIEKFLSYSNKSEYIILGLSFFSLTPMEELTQPSRFYAYFNEYPINILFKQYDKNEYYKMKYLPFYPYSQYTHTYYKNFLIGLKNVINNYQIKPDSLNGFTPHYSAWYGQDADLIEKEKIIINQNTLKNLNNLIIEASKNTKKVIFIISPLYYKSQKHFINYNQFKTTLKQFEEIGAFVYDFSTDSINYNKKYFYNNGHLNAIGAKLFSEKISNIILKL